MGLFDEVNKAVVNQQEQDTYSTKLQAAGVNIKNLRVQTGNGVLTIAGTVSDEQTAEKAVAALQGQPGVSQVVNLLEIEDISAQNIKMKIATKESNLNIRNGPGTNYDVVGKAAHGSTVQLIKKMYNNWYYIRTDGGLEGFCAANFLEQL